MIRRFFLPALSLAALALSAVAGGVKGGADEAWAKAIAVDPAHYKETMKRAHYSRFIINCLSDGLYQDYQINIENMTINDVGSSASLDEIVVLTVIQDCKEKYLNPNQRS